MLTMKLGVIFPEVELAPDATVIRDYVQAIEGLGFDHLAVREAVVGVEPRAHPGWHHPFTVETPFHEPFVLLGYAAAATTRLELATGVVILPRRPATLVAKQAAEVDILSGGRLRLGVSVGANWVEYEALGQEFHDRGDRIEEQIEVMRQLWTTHSVSFHGRWHDISDAGLNPRPIQQPIPIWMGGFHEKVLRRTGRIADGWISGSDSEEGILRALPIIHAAAQQAGRDHRAIGLEVRPSVGSIDQAEWRRRSVRWKELGVTHVTLQTIEAGLKTPEEHLEAAQRFKDAVDG
jgi:probable F420-dependent oxidoreductase